MFVNPQVLSGSMIFTVDLYVANLLRTYPAFYGNTFGFLFHLYALKSFSFCVYLSDYIAIGNTGPGYRYIHLHLCMLILNIGCIFFIILHCTVYQQFLIHLLVTISVDLIYHNHLLILRNKQT